MFAAAVVALTVIAAPLPQSPTHWVEDHVDLLTSDARVALDAKLASYQQATGHQVIVWIDRSTAGNDLAEWSARTFAAWQLGRRGLDDGVAIFVFTADRTVAIEVGYGLEDRLTDARASRIIRDVIAPKLRAGDRDGAVSDGVDEVLTAIEGKPWRPISGGVESPQSSTVGWLLGAFAVIAVLILAITHPRVALLLLWTLASNARRGFGGLGGFGGGGNPFSGRGGRSGGAGARGAW